VPTVLPGKTVIARVSIKNTGGQKGTFRLTGQILYGGTSTHAGWFTQRNQNYQPCPGGVAPEPDWNYVDVELPAGQTSVVTMYKANFACGQPTAFQDGQTFDVLWTLKCLETGQAVTKLDSGALVFRRPQPPKIQIIYDAMYVSPAVVHAGENVVATFAVRNVGESPGTFRISCRLGYTGGALHGQTYDYMSSRDKDYCGGVPKEPDWNYVDVVLQPSQRGDVKLYKRNFACGNPTAFPDGQQFFAAFAVKCLETGEEMGTGISRAITFRQGAVAPPSPPPPPAPPAPRIASLTMNKSVIYAGELLTGTASCVNTGGTSGRFRLTGTLYYEGGPLHGTYAGSMTQRNKNYKPCPGGADLEADWNYVEFSLNAGEQRDVTMYKANFACGNPLVFDDGQQFKIVWKLTCLDTGAEVTNTKYVTFRRS